MADDVVICSADAAGVTRAAAVIRAGGVIAFPTDTVYGLGCDLLNPAAVARIYAIKGRPAHLPLIAMLADAEQWPRVAVALPDAARALMARWWPGPLTLIVPARADLPAQVLGGGASIGIRIPDHPAALALLRAVDCPLATTSANQSGHPAGMTALEVADELGCLLDLILDGGDAPGGIASTVLDCTQQPPVILRAGPISREMLGL